MNTRIKSKLQDLAAHLGPENRKMYIIALELGERKRSALREFFRNIESEVAQFPRFDSVLSLLQEEGNREELRMILQEHESSRETD